MDYNFSIRQDAETNTIEVLEKLHTKQLLRILGEARLALTNYYLEVGSDDYKLFSDYKDRIKKVLATREHVPTKKEAKKIRQEKAKQKK